MSNEDVLQSLQPYFEDGISLGELDKIKELHDTFHRDFFENPVTIDGTTLKVKPYKYARSKKDGLPAEFEQFYEKFVHIITRDAKLRRKGQSKHREFDSKRANRIHWIRPILEHCADPCITRFEFIEDDGSLREYFWCRAVQYIVIIEYIRPDYALITGFCVDAENREYFQNKYTHREK